MGRREDATDPLRANPFSSPFEAPSDAVLLRKYRDLTNKYGSLIERMNDRARTTLDLAGMAGWALRASNNACALVRKSAIVVTNGAFQRMNRRGKDQAWRKVAAPEEPGRPRPAATFASLAQVVVEESGRLLGQRRQLERRVRYGNGRIVLELTCERASIGPGQTAVLVVARDVTQATVLEAELDRAHSLVIQQERFRALGELALGIAHDVKNILGAMQLRVLLLGRDEACRASQGDNIEALARIVEEGSALVSRLKSFGSPSAANDDNGEVDVVATIREAIEIAGSGLQLRARPGRANLSIDLAVTEVPLVRGSAREFRHVFVNLLINAVDAMPDGGRVKISAETTGHAVLVKIEDQGGGIPPEHMERIFEPFFTTKGVHGSGIGLALAKSVMAAAGGTITARNRPRGGACFELRFVRFRNERAPRRRFTSPAKALATATPAGG